MKNLVQGQEISRFKEIRGLSFLKSVIQPQNDLRDGCLGSILIVVFLLCWLIFDEFFYEYFNFFFENETNFFSRGTVSILSGILLLVLLVFFIFIIGLLTRLYVNPGNPSIIYFNNCLVVTTQGFGRKGLAFFKGEIHFSGIKRFILKGKKEIIVVLDKNSELFRSEDFFKNFDGELTFELTKGLQKISLQIVDELNSKVNKG